MLCPIDAIRVVQRRKRSEVCVGVATMDCAIASRAATLANHIRQMRYVPMDRAIVENEQFAGDNGVFIQDQHRELASAVKAVMVSDLARPSAKISVAMQSHKRLREKFQPNCKIFCSQPTLHATS
jgi:hypothetical protein